MTPGELELLAMTEASINSDEKFLLAFEAGVLNELEKMEQNDKSYIYKDTDRRFSADDATVLSVTSVLQET